MVRYCIFFVFFWNQSAKFPIHHWCYYLKAVNVWVPNHTTYVSSMVFSKKNWLNFFLTCQLLIYLFGMFLSKNWVIQGFQSLGCLVLAVTRWLFWLNFSSFLFLSLSFCTKTPQIREINSGLLLCLPVKIFQPIIFKKSY